MKHKLSYIILFFIVGIAVFLRIYQLGSVPASPDWDEVALGYNGYSILETGRDEYGEFLPIVLRSFDDYKPALYAYLIIPFIKLFGLTVFAVRLPSVIFGILTVLATYFLVKELLSLFWQPRLAGAVQNLHRSERFWNRPDQIGAPQNDEGIALLASFLLAVSPWHIQFSRIAFESNVSLAFNVFAILFFLKGLKKPYFFTTSAVFMALSLYLYQSAKIFVPILALLLVGVFLKQILSIPKKYIIVATLVGGILSFPIAHFAFANKAAFTRAKGVSIFTEESPFVKEYAQRLIIDKERNDIFGLIVDNRRIAYLKAMLSGYLSHYNFYWLFLSGDQPRHHAPEMGLLYLWELPFLLIGIYMLFFGKFDRRIKFLVFGWFFIAPIPAAFTTGVPHAVRTLNFLPTFQIFTAIGIISALQKISNFKYQISNIKYLKFLVGIFIFSFLIFNFSYYLNQYFVQQNHFYSEAWQYGYKEAVGEVKKIESEYERIVVSNQPHLDQSYIFFLFYLKYSPEDYQREGGSVTGGFKEDHYFDKYEFRPINWDEEERNGKTLFVGMPDDFRFKAASIIKVILFLNGKEAIKIVEG